MNRGVDPSVDSLAVRMVPEERSVRVGQQLVQLTQAEFNVLQILVDRIGSLVARADLDVRNRGSKSNVLEVMISRLRKKLASAETEMDIQTVRSRGYRLVVLPSVHA